MKKNPYILLALFAIVSISSCATAGSIQAGPEIWAGVYTGVIPAADGPGIAVRLYLNTDETYELHYLYVDRDSDIYILNGMYSWNAKTSLITLDTSPSYYRLGEHFITQLDMEGKEITGPLAEDYVLRKIAR